MGADELLGIGPKRLEQGTVSGVLEANERAKGRDVHDMFLFVVK
jgi:hypothetical protein